MGFNGFYLFHISLVFFFFFLGSKWLRIVDFSFSASFQLNYSTLQSGASGFFLSALVFDTE